MPFNSLILDFIYWNFLGYWYLDLRLRGMGWLTGEFVVFFDFSP
jgi:hypothetical protein